MASLYAMRLVVCLLLLPCLHAQKLENGVEGALAVSESVDTTWGRNKLLMDKNDVFSKREAVVREAGGDEVAAAVSGNGFTDATFTSLSMILVSEIGDETFIIAALMAMRHPRAVVLSGALSALIIMTVLSTGLGVIVPNLINKNLVNHFATGLYTFFGFRLLFIAYTADSTPQKELEEVEEKLEGGPKKKNVVRRIFSRFCTPVYLESFILTFLAEWGDRSQIATIAVRVLSSGIFVLFIKTCLVLYLFYCRSSTFSNCWVMLWHAAQ
uniref:GDT1 family protein n=1 Tax=Physcomitrium patens TaxID=3218 RepID=A0A7I4CXL2_PHYPA